MSRARCPVSLDLATTAAWQLLRTALLAKLAVDLEDPALARRAAREALTHARLLSGLDFPPGVEDDVHCGPRPLPTVGDLLERIHPPSDDGEAV